MPAENDDEFVEHWKTISSDMPSPETIGAFVTPLAVGKFDEFIPPDLLSRVAGAERLSVAEANEAIENLLREFSRAG